MITGMLTLLPTPCTTTPCLPGMALVVVAGDGAQYFLTKNGGYLQDLAGGQSMSQPGDKVIVSGTTQDQRDTAGNAFTIIEFVNLKQADKG